jgi:predicted ATP-dependent protease
VTAPPPPRSTHLISAITGIPLRQDLAVSGSINQMGEIQPVGGITQKVEGFFEVCKQFGLTGTQGVIIPAGEHQPLGGERGGAARRFKVRALPHLRD